MFYGVLYCKKNLLTNFFLYILQVFRQCHKHNCYSNFLSAVLLLHMLEANYLKLYY